MFSILKYNLKENLLDDNFKGLNVEQWVFDSGIPKNCPKINSLRFKNVESSVATFLDGEAQELKVISEKWSTHEWLHFLKHLPESLNLDKMIDLDKEDAGKIIMEAREPWFNQE